MASLTEYVVELEAEKQQLEAKIEQLSVHKLVIIVVSAACGFALGVIWALVWRAA